jgi:hypothetical protein
MILRTGTIFVLWLLLSIPSAGLLASALGYPSVWGNQGGVIADFLLPFPQGLGLLHIPSLLIFGLLLILQSSWRRGLRRLFQVGAVSLIVVALQVILAMEPASDPAPSTSAVSLLFLLSDATVALVLSLLVPGLDLDRARSGTERERDAAWPYVTGLGILAVSVMLLHQFHILSLPL